MKPAHLLAAAAAILVAQPALAAETLTATFQTPNGGQTTGQYSGIVRLTVSGTGMSNGSFLNDAFYDVATQTRNSSYYQLTFGTSPLVALDPSQNAVNRIVGGVPAFDPTGVYSFLLNTGATTPSTLYFGVGDGQFGDNSGAYSITVTAGVPEPASWAMMIGGFGIAGGALRRRRAQVRTAVSFG